MATRAVPHYSSYHPDFPTFSDREATDFGPRREDWRSSSPHVSGEFHRVDRDAVDLERADFEEEGEWVLREEVPFERWLHEFGQETFASDHIMAQILSRRYALITWGESLLKVGIEATAFPISKLIEKVFSVDLRSSRHSEVLQEQIKSLQFSWKAILSPKDAVEQALPRGKAPLFGCREEDHAWGTLYEGRRHNPFAFECCDFPWMKA